MSKLDPISVAGLILAIFVLLKLLAILGAGAGPTTQVDPRPADEVIRELTDELDFRR